MREFKVGDKVVCEKYGEGIVTDIDLSETDYPIKVNFSGNYILYTLEGYYWSKHYSISFEKDKDIEHIEETMKQVTQAEVFTEFARVAKLIEGTELKLIDVFKYANERPQFEYSYEDSMLGDYDKYTFALALVEGKPIFAGDTLYNQKGEKYTVQEVEQFGDRLAFRSTSSPYIDGDYVDLYTWKQPKKTFMLNGIELPCPTDDNSNVHLNVTYNYDNGTTNLYYPVPNEILKYRWDTMGDRDRVMNAIIDLLDGVA